MLVSNADAISCNVGLEQSGKATQNAARTTAAAPSPGSMPYLIPSTTCQLLSHVLVPGLYPSLSTFAQLSHIL